MHDIILKLAFGYNHPYFLDYKINIISCVITETRGCFCCYLYVQQVVSMANKLCFRGFEAYLNYLNHSLSCGDCTRKERISVSALASLCCIDVQKCILSNCLAKPDHGIHWPVLFLAAVISFNVIIFTTDKSIQFFTHNEPR